jgi:hypothetical protein
MSPLLGCSSSSDTDYKQGKNCCKELFENIFTKCIIGERLIVRNQIMYEREYDKNGVMVMAVPEDENLCKNCVYNDDKHPKCKVKPKPCSHCLRSDTQNCIFKPLYRYDWKLGKPVAVGKV